jgi:phosphate transport system permease protein
MSGLYLVLFAGLMCAAFALGRWRAQVVAGGSYAQMHSLPAYHGLFVVCGVFTPMLAVFVIGMPITAKLASSAALAQFPADVQLSRLQSSAALRDVQSLLAGRYVGEANASLKAAAAIYTDMRTRGASIVLGAGLGVGLLALGWCLSLVSMHFRARNYVERFISVILLVCAAVAVLTTIGIVLSVVTETYRFFFDPEIKGRPGVFGFLFGTEWNPQAALRADQGDIRTAFGFLPLLVGTLLITTVAISVAGPLGLFSAIYLAEYASPRLRSWAKPVLEILAGIPTVVLGFFAALTVAPFIRGWGTWLGLDVASESALAAGLVMGMMIIPFVSSLSDDVINAVPQALRDGAYALGATKSETLKQVVLPAALPGIVSAFMLAISRAIGETMIVVMAAGLAANLTFNPLEAVTTITVQIKTILVGDQEFDSAKTLSAFALGFVLFFITLTLNYIALRVVRRYREQYE